jgi:ribosomal protein L2
MGIRKYNPTTPGQDLEPLRLFGITVKNYKPLTRSKEKIGRNSGRITSYNRGGGTSVYR